MSDQSLTLLMNRRQALAMGGLSLAGLALPSAMNAAEPNWSQRIKKAVKYHMVQDESMTVLQKFQLVKELGFDGIEIRTRDKVNPDDVLAARDESGLPIHGVVNSSSPDIRSAVDLSKKYGGTSVLVVAGRVTKEMPYEQNYKEWKQRLIENAPYAAEEGIDLLVENVWNNFLFSPMEMARFIDEIGQPNVGVYFDVGNVVRIGFPDQWIRILGSRIKKLDIKEYSRELQNNEGLRKGFQVEIGEGDSDYPAVMKALADINYAGWATAEVPGGGRERLQEIAMRMNIALNLSSSKPQGIQSND